MDANPEAATPLLPGRPRSPAKKWLMLALKLAIVVLVVVAVRHTLYDGLNKLRQHEFNWTFRPGWALAAGAIYLLGMLPAGLFWHRVLHVLGQHARLGETLRAYYIGHLGKYVPGKALVVIIRAGMVRSERVDTAVAAVSVFYETLTMMAAGAAIAAAILAVWFRTHLWLSAISVGLMVVAGLPTLPPVFRRLVRLVGVGRSDPETTEKIARLGYGTLVLGWIYMSIAWVLLAVSLWATLRAIGLDADLAGQLHLYTACVSLATVAGFLSLIPGGLFVRDVILIQLIAMTPHVGDAAAVVSAILARLIWLVSEVVISGILYSIGTLARLRNPPESHSIER